MTPAQQFGVQTARTGEVEAADVNARMAAIIEVDKHILKVMLLGAPDSRNAPADHFAQCKVVGGISIGVFELLAPEPATLRLLRIDGLVKIVKFS